MSAFPEVAPRSLRKQFWVGDLHLRRQRRNCNCKLPKAAALKGGSGPYHLITRFWPEPMINSLSGQEPVKGHWGHPRDEIISAGSQARVWSSSVVQRFGRRAAISGVTDTPKPQWWDLSLPWSLQTGGDMRDVCALCLQALYFSTSHAETSPVGLHVQCGDSCL